MNESQLLLFDASKRERENLLSFIRDCYRDIQSLPNNYTLQHAIFSHSLSVFLSNNRTLYRHEKVSEQNIEKVLSITHPYFIANIEAMERVGR